MTRVDAQINRRRILDVAHEAFLAGDDTSMNQIAKRAGVGAGTLYRNFPTREALVLAVYRADIDELIALVPGLLAGAPPLAALRRWTIQLVSAMRMKHGLGDALSPSAHQSIIDVTCGPVTDAITRLLDAGKQDGSIRADANPNDFLQLTGALWRAALGPEDRSLPMLDLILDGLSTRRTPRRTSVRDAAAR